ncbi:hypothetical protein QR680_016950 [Steinernema hermaphroditum]|uniref:Amiloride-sensitive sodium channel n=1 Tax=Steinernema hermaphroditum TaxID=289476 RepID=A0AA39HCU0_9BILA|nr:hypothetical protein QR680_016950 [Steinernema hermaphroditum]
MSSLPGSENVRGAALRSVCLETMKDGRPPSGPPPYSSPPPPSTKQNPRVRGVVAPLVSFSEWTTCHGIPQAVRSKKCFFIVFWSLITVVASALMIWQVSMLVMKYYAYPITVSIELKFEQRPFPAVTVCNLNPYKASELKQFPNVKRLLDTYQYALEMISCGEDPRCSGKVDETLEGYRKMYGLMDILDSGALQTHTRNLLALEMGAYNAEDAVDSLPELIRSCSFNTYACNLSDWTAWQDPRMGQCFTFNQQSNHSAKRAGPTYGLRLLLLTDRREYLATSESAGMRVIVTDQTELIFPDITGYVVATGTSASIGVNYREVSRLGPPYGKCSNEKPSNFLYARDGDYSAEACQRSMYQQEMVERCGCYDPSYPKPHYADVEVCRVETASQFNCWRSLTKQSSFNNCTQPCREGVYQGLVSSARWPSGSTESIGGCMEGTFPESCYETYKNNGALVEVYYSKLNYESMKESGGYSIVSLLSDLGGQIGLWLGLSIISLVEFVILVMQVCLGFCNPKTVPHTTPPYDPPKTPF